MFILCLCLQQISIYMMYERFVCVFSFTFWFAWLFFPPRALLFCFVFARCSGVCSWCCGSTSMRRHSHFRTFRRLFVVSSHQPAPFGCSPYLVRCMSKARAKAKIKIKINNNNKTATTVLHTKKRRKRTNC